MSNLVDIWDVPPQDVWGEIIRARRIEGERLTLAVVELAPNGVVPGHQHEHEQIGIVITGAMRFTVDGETRDLGPGGTWRILSGRSHGAVAGPEGATVIDVFAPLRSDWDDFERLEPQRWDWPPRE